MFICPTGIDDITTVLYEKIDFIANCHKNSMSISSEISQYGI